LYTPLFVEERGTKKWQKEAFKELKAKKNLLMPYLQYKIVNNCLASLSVNLA